MKKLDKRVAAGLLAGAILAGGLFGTYQMEASAAEQVQEQQAQMRFRHHGEAGSRYDEHRRQRQERQFDADKMATELSAAFDVSKDEVLAAINDKKDMRDIGHAAVLAKASGKSFADVLAMRADGKNWRAVTESLGLSREDIRKAHDNAAATVLESKVGVERATASRLLADGYRVQDVSMAGILAKESGKDIDTVLSMRKINNTWRDVAASLGISEDAMRSAMRDVMSGFGMHFGPGEDGHWHGHHGPRGEQQAND